MKIRVSIVEDDAGLRESLAAVVNSADELECVSLHPNAEHACRFLPSANPDVALVDIHLPKQSGIECVRALKARFPKLQILMHTIYDDSRKIFESLRAGASGYLLKRTPPQKIVDAIREVYQGGAPMSAPVARLVVASFNNGQGVGGNLPRLSPREESVLKLLAGGARSKEVAAQLGISTTTVRTHLDHIYQKLHARSRAEAVAKYMSRPDRGT